MSTENTAPETPAELPPPADDTERQRQPKMGFYKLALVAITLFTAALAVWLWQEIDRKNEANQRLADAERSQLQTQLQAQLQSLQTRLTALESRQSEAASQSETLRATVDNLAINNEETALREVELALTLGAQQLQLAANVSAATLALQTAEARLAGLDPARYQPLRAAIAKDLSRLKGQPQFDIASANRTLEEAISRVDKLPLGEAARPAANPEATAEPAAAETAWWRLAAADVWRQLRGLVRSQRMDREEPPLLAPEQIFFLRENLKLRLLDARLALHARDQATLRSDLKAATDWLQRFFAANDPAVQEMLGQLQPLSLPAASGKAPDLSNSLAALAKLRREQEATRAAR